MGVANSPRSQRHQPTRHSIWFGFTTMVIIPVCGLLVLWGLLVGFTPGGALIRTALVRRGHHGLADIALQTGVVLIVMIAAIVLMGMFARRLRQEITDLERGARHLADVQLPQVTRSLRSDEQPAEANQALETQATKTREIAGVAAAITSLRHAAVGAAVDEASLRNGIAQVFVSLARRNQSLLQRQLHLIDALEQKSADPDELADLFSLDHLTTRMRRHAENLIILSGASPGRSWSEPVPVIDVIRGATAEVEDYQRVRVLTRSQDAVVGAAVADMIHLLAELIENATLFSPSGTRVEVRAERVANGFVVEVEDRGLGIQPDRLAEINQNLASPPDFALADPDRLGLFVVAKLAARHGSRVSLNPSPYGGTTAVMLIPHSVVVSVAEERAGISAGIQRAGISAGDERRPGTAARESAVPGWWSEEPVTATRQRPAVPLPDGQAQAGTAVGWWAEGGGGQPGGLSRPSGGRDAEPPPAAAAPLPRRAAGGQAERGDRPRSPVPPTAGAGGSPGADLAGRPLDPRGSNPLGLKSSTPVTDGAQEPAAETADPAVRDQAAGTYRGLPRRVRQASLNAHLRDRSPADTAPLLARTQSVPPANRTPEKARDVVASFRSGWQRTAQADAPVTPADTGDVTGGSQDRAAADTGSDAHREETQWTNPARPDPEQT